jgi:RNA polymerase-binding transcription factor DksA
MQHISEDTLADLETALQAEQAAVEEELADHGKSVDEEGEDWEGSSESEGEEPDGSDAADNMEELGTNVPLVADLKKRHKEIKSALRKMKDGTYGTCDECGEDIDVARLEANPAAATCIRHAE